MFAYDEDIAIACVYFDHKQDFKPVAILRSILKNVVQRQENGLSDEVAQLFRKHNRRKTQPTLSEVSDVLQLEICDFSKIFIVLDALDECSTSENATEKLLAELQKLQPKLHLMVTSRPFAVTEMCVFDGYETLQVRAKDSDVEKFVQGRIEMDKTLRRHASEGSELGKVITETVVGKANGM
jgi:hypothetical protein